MLERLVMTAITWKYAFERARLYILFSANRLVFTTRQEIGSQMDRKEV